MASEPALIYTDNPGAVPASYVLGPTEVVELMSSSATFNGASAGAAFLPCLAAYSQDGKLIGRWFPPTSLAAGDSAEVSFGVPAALSVEGATKSVYHSVAAGSNNAAVIKASAGLVYGWYVYNNAASARYVKLYNKASSPSPGSDTPVLTIGLASGAAANILSDDGLPFGTGIGIAMVTGISDTDNTAVTASDLVATIFYA